jgi:hypothetical protein
VSVGFVVLGELRSASCSRIRLEQLELVTFSFVPSPPSRVYTLGMMVVETRRAVGIVRWSRNLIQPG